MDDADFNRLMDETMQRQLGHPSELELIEILNKHEYQLELEQNSPALSRFADGGAERLSQTVLIREHLARRQGGTLDRFGLRDLSAVELDHRRQEVERFVQELEAQFASRPQKQTQATSALGEMFKGFGQMLSGPDPIQYQLFVKKKLLSELNLQVKLHRAGPPRKSIAEQKQQKTEAALRKITEFQIALQKALDGLPPGTGDDLKKAIRRSYQAEIDRVRDNEL